MMTTTTTRTYRPRLRPDGLRQAAVAAYAEAAAVAARRRAEQEARRRAEEHRRLTTRLWERWGLEVDDDAPMVWRRLPGWPAAAPGGVAPELPVLLVDEVAIACSADGGLMIAIDGQIGPDEVVEPVWHAAPALADVGQVLAGLAAEAATEELR